MKTTRSLPPARKRFGQHFLEPAWADKVVAAIDPQPDEDFVEIGPGRGALTARLAARARSVLAYEIDRDLVRALQSTMPPNARIVSSDFLALTAIETPGERRFRVAGNLPYNVASPIVFKLVELYDHGAPFSDATVMLQREVADRLQASPGTRDYGVLTVLIGHSASVQRVLNLPAGAFRPPPRVLSSLVRLSFHPPDPPVRDRAVFSALVQAVFTRRRKTLANALLAYPGASRGRLPEWIDPSRRPETLTIAEFARLADVLAK